jgi:hypothetical protein
VLALLASACGNYSNEDLDFQLAVPEQADIEAKLQVSVNRPDSAEYYKNTRSAVTTFNAMVVDLTQLVDHVRGYAPTSRSGNQRTWGPFPSGQYPNWQVRVVMTKSTVSADLLHMDYEVDLRQVGQGDAAWVSFLAGNYTSQGSARTGQGAIHLLAQAVRADGYPVDDDPGLATLDHLDVTYDTTNYPRIVVMEITNLPSAATQSGRYQYSEAQDGSGSMQFDWQGLTDTGVQAAATMKSRWQGTGPGRADLILESTAIPITLGTDCWGADTTPTYTFRLQGNAATGDPQTCVF